MHRFASLAKRWLPGTHPQSCDDAHLPSYLNEFVYRFNHGYSPSRGIVLYRVPELTVGHNPVRYQAIIVGKYPPIILPTPSSTRERPPGLNRLPASHPWRAKPGKMQTR